MSECDPGAAWIGQVCEAARGCAAALGGSAVLDMTLDLVLPRLRGEGAGMDTAVHRRAGEAARGTANGST